MAPCQKESGVHMYGRLHADICNVPKLILNGLKIQIKLTKAKPAFYVLSNKEDSKAYLKILEALLYVKRIRPSAGIITAHNETLLEGYLVRYNLTESNSRPSLLPPVRNHSPWTTRSWVDS